MYNTMFSKGSLPALEQVIYFTTERQRILMNNLANVDTPGYKTMDVPHKSFQKALQEAFAEQRASNVGVFEFLGKDGIRPQPGGGLFVKPVESKPSPNQTGILRHAKNNVDMDVELGKMVENAILHNTAVALLNHQLGMIHEVISERVTG